MSTKHYFDVDGVPGLWEEGQVPQILSGGVEWVPYYNLQAFFNNAVPVTKERFDALKAQYKVPAA